MWCCTMAEVWNQKEMWGKGQASHFGPKVEAQSDDLGVPMVPWDHTG